MKIAQNFAAAFVEITAFMILWCKFNVKSEKIIIKNLIIIVSTSFIIAMKDYINVYVAMFLSYLTIICLVSILYNRKFMKSLFEICLNSVLVMALELIAACILKKFIPNTSPNAGLFVFTDHFIVLTISIIIYLAVPNKKINTMLKIDTVTLNYFAINLILYIISSKVIWDYDKTMILDNIVILAPILIIMFSFSIYISYRISKINEHKKLLQLNNRYNPIIENIIEELRRKQHEFKNQLNTINGIIQVSKEGQLKESLAEYMKHLKYNNKDIEDIIYIDNTIVRAIIYSKLCDAEKLGINFTYNITSSLSKLNLKEYELSEIVTNLLNNAFEAVSNEQNKNVIFNVLREDSKYIIEVKNNTNRIDTINISKIFNRGFSTKEGKNRGYGLYNVKKIVEFNNGKIQMSIDEGQVCFKIIFLSNH